MIKVQKNYQVYTLTGDLSPVVFMGVEDECPICHIKHIPKYISGAFIDKTEIDLSFQCTNSSCHRLYISHYKLNGTIYNFNYSYPKIPIEQHFGYEVSVISPSFCSIYNQAKTAEDLQLDQIAGLGYRKAIEFLVKDFAISRNESEEKKIKKLFLSDCINQYIDDSMLRECIKRATWLGNDEAHYLRKWEDKDIDDLKVLIKISVNFIESHLVGQKYISEMPV